MKAKLSFLFLSSCFLLFRFPGFGFVELPIKGDVAFVSGEGNLTGLDLFQDPATVFGLMRAFGVSARSQKRGKFGKGKGKIFFFHKEETLKIQKRKTGGIRYIDGIFSS